MNILKFDKNKYLAKPWVERRWQVKWVGKGRRMEEYGQVKAANAGSLETDTNSAHALH